VSTTQHGSIQSSFRGVAGLRRLAVLLVVALLPVVFVPTGAQAAPKTIAEVKRDIEKLRHEAEQASENYNDNRERIKSLEVRIKAARTREKQQRARVQLARVELGRLAAETYKSGELSGLELFLSDTPDLTLAQTGVLTTLGERRVEAIERLRREQATLAAATKDVADQGAKIVAAGVALKAAKAKVEGKLSAAEAILDRLTTAQRRAIERASRDQERREAREDRESAPATGGSGKSVSCGDTSDAPSARVAAVLSWACRQLGKPYKWGAEGPDSYDCSGFTLKAWAKGGVSLPHSSKAQAGYGSRVSVSDLQPGDLIFFHSPISHVGIYLGGGQMIHAPRSGDVVKVSGARLGSVVAAVRL